jgi:molybdenum cofactor cytidylyltransferase
MIDRSCSAAIVTAAGFSSRMGLPKAMLDWNGVTLLQHQLTQLADWGAVCLVLGHEAERLQKGLRLPGNFQVIVNPGFASGRASSLRAGFAALKGEPEAVLVVGVDQPLDALTLDLLVDAMTPEDAIAMPVSGGKRGHPVLFAGRLLDELNSIREETEGLRAVVRRHPARLVEVPGPFWDLNHPEDYEQARATLSLADMRSASDAGHGAVYR